MWYKMLNKRINAHSKILKTFLLFSIFISVKAYSQVYSLSLRQAEDQALSTSNTLKSTVESGAAAEFGADAQQATLWPKLTLNGNYYYQTNVPQLELPIPKVSPFNFGANDNYTFGLNLSYTLFDGGATYHLWKSSLQNSQAKLDEIDLTKKQLILSIQKSYVKVQLSIENTTLTAKSLLLSRARFNDVNNRFHAGSASKLDFVNSKRELLEYQLKLKQEQNTLAADLRDLVNLTGGNQEVDYSRPWPQGLSQEAIPGLDSPTSYLQFDPLSANLNDNKKEFVGPNAEHPQIRTLSDNAEALRLSAKAAGAVQWPKISLSATGEYLYPNGPILQKVQQNILAINVSMPLFEYSQSHHVQSQHAAEAASLDFQKYQRMSELDRDFRKAKDLLDNLISQEILSHENAEQTEIVATLTYQSYRAGKQQYLDVETANLKSLESQVALAQVRANILTTEAQLQYLSSGKKESQ